MVFLGKATHLDQFKGTHRTKLNSHRAALAIGFYRRRRGTYVRHHDPVFPAGMVQPILSSLVWKY